MKKWLVYKKLCAMFCVIALCIQLIPTVMAMDLISELAGEQVIDKQSLENLMPTETDGILKTVNNEYLTENDDGSYIVLEKHKVSFENEALLQAQLQALDIPEDLKQSVRDKYETLQQYGMEKDIQVSIYEGVKKINANGRSVIGDLPVITAEGRKFKVYKIDLTNIKIDKKIVKGKQTVPMLKNTTALVLTIIGTGPVGETVSFGLGVASAGMTLFDICCAALDFGITGTLDDAHYVKGNYSGVENHYYIHLETLEEWRRVLITESVSIHEMTFTTYLCHNPEPGTYIGETAHEKTVYNLNYKTESFGNPFKVAVQHQFSGKFEEITIRYQGKDICF